MNLRIRRGLVALAFALAPSLALAQGQPVFQSGTAMRDHLTKFWGSGGLIGDVGGINGDTNGRGVAPFSITDTNGLGLCSNTGVTNGAYSSFCIGHDSNGNALLSQNSYGGTVNKTAYFNINGQNYEIPFTTGGAVGPNPTVVPHLPVWNNTTGTLLADSGYAFFTPEDYGAVGDCSTNDSVAMQAAITAAQALHAKLWLGPKCYMATDLLISSAMWLAGSGQSATSIKNPSTGLSSNILKIGQTAPTASQVQGVMVTDLALSGNTASAGWALSVRHTANTIVQNIYLDQVFCGIEDEQSNSDMFINISGYTRGSGCAAFKWWTDATAMGDGGRSDQLSLYDVKINNQYGGNDGLVLSGFVQTINAVNVVMLQSNRGLYIDASLNDVNRFPGFGAFYNLQMEGCQTACVWIGGGREFYFSASTIYSFYGQTGTLGNQGNNDTAAMVIRSDSGASVTSSIAWNGGSIGGSAHQAIVMQAQGVRISDVGIKSGSYASANAVPSVELQNLDATGSADYQFSNVKFCGIYGNAGNYNYGLIRDADVGQTQIVGGDFNYCTTGAIQDNATDRMVVSASIDQNLRPLPESRRVFVSNKVPTLADDCAGANATIDPTSTNAQGTIGVTGGAPVKTTCTINFASTNAANNNGLGNLRAALFQPTGALYYKVTAATATSISFQRSDGGDLAGQTIPYVIYQESSP